MDLKTCANKDKKKKKTCLPILVANKNMVLILTYFTRSSREHSNSFSILVTEINKIIFQINDTQDFLYQIRHVHTMIP